MKDSNPFGLTPGDFSAEVLERMEEVEIGAESLALRTRELRHALVRMAGVIERSED